MPLLKTEVLYTFKVQYARILVENIKKNPNRINNRMRRSHSFDIVRSIVFSIAPTEVSMRTSSLSQYRSKAPVLAV